MTCRLLRPFALLPFLALLFVAQAPAAEAPPAEADTPPAAGHSHHGEAFNEGPRQQAYPIEGTGRVNFPATTKHETARQFINQGVGALHGFWYLEAERAFRQAAAIDPDCAIAYWGMAMANVNNEKRAKGFIAEAAKRKKQASAHEALYIDALDAYYKADAAKKKERGEAYLKALENICLKHPDDLEAKAFLALQFWNNRKTGNPILSYLAVDALLKQVLAVEPLHPCHHYVIHLWDYEKPELALDSAAKCGPAAPAIAHMWHMPGHIYSRLKRYHDAVWQQEASARVDHAHMIRDRLLPDQIHNFAHNNEWLIRNLNHIGRARDAVALAKNMAELPRHPEYNTLDKQGSAHYGRLRLFETLDRWELWNELIELAQTPYLEETEKTAEQIKRLRFLGRAYFLTGQIDQGRQQLAALDERLSPLLAERLDAVQQAEAVIRDEIARREDPKQTKEDDQRLAKARTDAEKPFANKIGPLEKAIDEMRGHLAMAEGNHTEALELFKKSGIDAMFTARMQSKAGQHAAAEKAVRNFIKGHKNEVQPLAQLVEVLWQAGKRDEAETAFNKLRQQASALDLDLPIARRLAPIAAELGLPSDWRLPYSAPADLGERPDLATLGPFRWHPSPAEPWSLTDAAGRRRSLDEYRGRPVLVIFYLGFGCLHCAQQLQAFGPKTQEFAAAGIDIVAVSTDSQTDLRHSIENYGTGEFPFPLVSDAPLDVFKAYRCYDDFEQQPLHGTFLIDGNGLVRWQDIGPEPFMQPDFVLKEAKRLLGQDVSNNVK